MSQRSWIWSALSAYAVFALSSMMLGAVDMQIDLGTLADLFREPLAIIVTSIGNVLSAMFDIDFAPIAVVAYVVLYVISLFAITLMNLKPGVGVLAWFYAVLHIVLGLLFFPLLFWIAASRPRRSSFSVPNGWFRRMIGGLLFALLVIILIVAYAILGGIEVGERISGVNECFAQIGTGTNLGECFPGRFGELLLELEHNPEVFRNEPAAIALVGSIVLGSLAIFLLPVGFAVGHKLRIGRMFGRVMLAGVICAAVAFASLALEGRLNV